MSLFPDKPSGTGTAVACYPDEIYACRKRTGIDTDFIIIQILLVNLLSHDVKDRNRAFYRPGTGDPEIENFGCRVGIEY